jgi:transcriptional regulator with XRE-family HTH domain
MAGAGRPAHRGRALARELVTQACRDIRLARIAAGLSQRTAARAAGMSQSQFGRLERGQIRYPTLDQLSRAAAVVGLKLTLRAFPDGDPIRDAAHARLLERFRRQLGPGIVWRTEVPVQGATDLRGWDGLAIPPGERIGVEAETRLRDGQSTWRRTQRKRDADHTVGSVILLLADTRANRDALKEIREALRADLPLDTRAVLAALRAGRAPGASGIVLL